MSISFSGLASGLDTSSWVESLVALKRAKVTTLEEQKEVLSISKDTLASIKSFFNSFRSTLEKITDTKFNIASMDLFSQSLAVSSKPNILTATSNADAEEATYEIKVDNIATNTKVESGKKSTGTRVEYEIADNNTLLKDLGVTAGRIEIQLQGRATSVDITEGETIVSFVEKLNSLGVDAKYDSNTGIFSIDTAAGSINDIEKTGIVDALHLSEVNADGYMSKILTYQTIDNVWAAAEGTTLLNELGVQNGTIQYTVEGSGAIHNFDITETTSLNDLISDMNSSGLTAALDASGYLTINNGNITDVGTTDIVNALGLNSVVSSNSMSSNSISYSYTITATSSTTMDELGVSTNGFKSYVRTLSAEEIANDSTYDDYIKVSNRAELEAALSNSNAKIILTNDIDLSESFWEEIGSFSGVLDGNGHTISNLRILNSSYSSWGFFGELNGATIKNLKFDNVNISMYSIYGEPSTPVEGGGILAGKAISSQISNVVVDGQIALGGTAGGNIGGLLGTAESTQIEDSIANVDFQVAKLTVSDYTNRLGGFLGYSNGQNRITGCVANIKEATSIGDSVTSGEGLLSVAGIFSTNIDASDLGITDCYAIVENTFNGACYDFNCIFANNIDENEVAVQGYLGWAWVRHYAYGSKPDYANCNQKSLDGFTSDLAIHDKTGHLVGTIDIAGTDTIQDVLNKLSTYGFTGNIDSNGVITLSNADRYTVSGLMAEKLGFVESDVYEKTIGVSRTSTAAVNVSKTLAVSGTTTLEQVDFKKINGVITSTGVTGTTIGISSVEDLLNLESLVNSGTDMSGKTFVLTNDIDLGGRYICIGKNNSFAGTFDGQGHTLSNLGIKKDESSYYSGLFGYVVNAEIKNLNLDVVESTYYGVGWYTGALAGLVRDSAISNIKVTNMSIQSSATASEECTAGLIGCVEGSSTVTITGCSVQGGIYENGYTVGATRSGLISCVNGNVTISQCESDVNVYYETSSGYLNATGAGMIGKSNSVGASQTIAIENCLVKGNLSNIVSTFNPPGILSGGGLSIKNSCLIVSEALDGVNLLNYTSISESSTNVTINIENSCVMLANPSAHTGDTNFSGSFVTTGTAGTSSENWSTDNFAACYNFVTGGAPNTIWKYDSETNILSLCADGEYNLKVIGNDGNIQNYYTFSGATTLDEICSQTGLFTVSGNQLVGIGANTVTLSGGVADTLGLTTADSDSKELSAKENQILTQENANDVTFYELGFTSSVPRTVGVVSNGVSSTITFTSTTTVGSFMDSLNSKGFNCSVTDGKLTIEADDDCYIATDKGSNLRLYLKLSGSTSSGYKLITTQTMTTGATPVINDDRYIADSKLINLGVTSGEYDVYNNGVKYTINLDNNDTVGDVLATLRSYGLEAKFNAGKIELVGTGDSYIATSESAAASNIVDVLFTSPKETFYDYNANVSILESTTTMEADATESTLLSHWNNTLSGNKTQGDLSVKIDGIESIVNIKADDTVGSFINKLKSLGLDSELKDGKLYVSSGYKTLELSGYTGNGNASDIVNLLNLTVTNNLDEYLGSSVSCEYTVTIQDETTASAAKFADKSTKLSTLNISNGLFTIYKDGVKSTIQVDSTDTFEQFEDKIQQALTDDVQISFKDGYFSLESVSGAKLAVGTSSDKSNIMSVLGLKQVDGIVTSSRELYCVNGNSILTQSGLFTLGTVSEGTFKIGDETFTIDSTTTLDGLISQINSSEKSSVTASWDSISGKLTLKSRITGSALVNIEAGDSNFTNIMGWTDSGKLVVENQELGTNASFTINGTQYTSVSNTIDSSISRIKGLTINLKDVSGEETVTLSVEKDKDRIADAVSDVVNSYNELVKNIDKEMEKGQPLADQSTLKFIRNQIRNLMTSSFAADGVYKSLDSIGISVDAATSGNINTDNINVLTFDKDKFTKAYNSDWNSIKSLLVGTESKKGIFSRIESIVESAVGTQTGYFSSAEKSYNTQISKLENRIKSANESVNRYKELLESKFSAMDLLISKMQNQYSSFLSY